MGQLVPGRVESRVSTADPVPSLSYTLTAHAKNSDILFNSKEK